MDMYAALLHRQIEELQKALDEKDKKIEELKIISNKASKWAEDAEVRIRELTALDKSMCMRLDANNARIAELEESRDGWKKDWRLLNAVSGTLDPIVRLPKWAQRRIAELEERVKRAEATIPWTAPGMEWFTLFWPGPEPRDRAPQRLFTCGEGGTMLVCTLGPEDYVFVGRGKKPNSAISGGEQLEREEERSLNWARVAGANQLKGEVSDGNKS